MKQSTDEGEEKNPKKGTNLVDIMIIKFVIMFDLFI